jgi:hypothetical protein
MAYERFVLKIFPKIELSVDPKTSGGVAWGVAESLLMG